MPTHRLGRQQGSRKRATPEYRLSMGIDAYVQEANRDFRMTFRLGRMCLKIRRIPIAQVPRFDMVGANSKPTEEREQ